MAPARAGGPGTVYLHVGLHKTGTTFLQNLLRANRGALVAQGVCLPGSNPEAQKLAVWDLVGRRPKGCPDDRINGRWQRLVEEVATSGARTGLVSVEYLSLATVAQARRVVAGFPDSEVHVVVTVRDLGRVLVSAWQEEVKNDATLTWPEFVEAVRDPAARARNPARGFWLRQDAAAVAETWRAVVPAERVHVVTVPPAGCGPDVLVERFCRVVGVDPASLTESPPWGNEAVGAAATEVLRRLNEGLGNRLNQRQYRRVVKARLTPALAAGLPSPRMVLPPEHEAWVRACAEEQRAALAAAGYPVTGDLTELLPTVHQGGCRPDEATAEETLDAAMVALTAMTELYAQDWWTRRRPDRPADAPRAVRLAGSLRGASFRARRRAAELADTHAAAGRVMALYLDRRAAGRRRSAQRR